VEQPPTPKPPPSAEQIVLIIGFMGFFAFMAIIAFMFVPLLSGRPLVARLPQALIDAAATRGFELPPTWTPGPTPDIQATAIPTQVYDGVRPTPIYTPGPPSVTAQAFLTALAERLNRPLTPRDYANVLDLARIMQGESTSDLVAARYVGWVAKNRLLHTSYGDSFLMVSSGFFGYNAAINPRPEFIDLAKRVIREPHDPTGGCLYALSRTDITNLGIPPERADLNINEWFFFKVWPVPRRS
jgi:hypothetical protein